MKNRILLCRLPFSFFLFSPYTDIRIDIICCLFNRVLINVHQTRLRIYSLNIIQVWFISILFQFILFIPSAVWLLFVYQGVCVCLQQLSKDKQQIYTFLIIFVTLQALLLILQEKVFVLILDPRLRIIYSSTLINQQQLGQTGISKKLYN